MPLHDKFEEPPAILCRVCHTPVDVHEFFAGDILTSFTYEHSMALAKLDMPDHEVEPMLYRDFDEVVGICDFCGDPMPSWRYPARTFNDPASDDPDETSGYGSVGDWAACDACHRLIERDDYRGVLRRFINNHSDIHSWPRSRRDILKVGVTALHQRFRANRLGPAIHLLRTD